MNSRTPESLRLEKTSKIITCSDPRAVPRPHPKGFQCPGMGAVPWKLWQGWKSLPRRKLPGQQHPNSDRTPGNAEPALSTLQAPVHSKPCHFPGCCIFLYMNQFVPWSINCLTSDLNELSASQAAEFCPQQKYPIYRSCSVPGASSEDWNCVSFSHSFPEPCEHGAPGDFCHFCSFLLCLAKALTPPSQANLALLLHQLEFLPNCSAARDPNSFRHLKSPKI